MGGAHCYTTSQPDDWWEHIKTLRSQFFLILHKQEDKFIRCKFRWVSGFISCLLWQFFFFPCVSSVQFLYFFPLWYYCDFFYLAVVCVLPVAVCSVCVSLCCLWQHLFRMLVFSLCSRFLLLSLSLLSLDFPNLIWGFPSLYLWSFCI